MENTATHFECEVKDLSYYTIEREISNYFNMGIPDNSNIPPEMKEDSWENCILVCTEKSGEFSIRNYRLTNGNIFLSVTLKGKIHKS
ncbi:hypothetical protein [Clostridium sp. KNHs205]|uniref:hypothetical protein n=1 Tax=Clostridium sp. KNHs205 TaxID=1449050 RepID=UPI00051B0B0D|nr:hypothetical protein [Clostridium sp. KNHs205]